MLAPVRQNRKQFKKCKHCVWHVHFVMFSRYVELKDENFKIVYLENTHAMENRHSTQYVYFVSLYKFICIISCSDKYIASYSKCLQERKSVFHEKCVSATSNKWWNVPTKSCKTPKYDDNLLSGS